MHKRSSLLFLTLMLLLCACSRVPSEFRGRWYLDDDYPNGRPHFIEFYTQHQGLWSDGVMDDTLRWRSEEDRVTIVVGNSDTAPELSVSLADDGRLVVTDRSNGQTSHFRHERTVAFVRPLLGEWQDAEAWLTIHEGGWGSLRFHGGITPVRIEERDDRIVWSERFFERRIYSTISVVDSGETLEFVWPNGKKQILRRKG